MKQFETVKFSEAYHLANEIWSHVCEWSDHEELDSYFDPADRQVSARLTSPYRETLLHLFLRRFYWDQYIDAFEHHRNDMLDLVIAEYEAVLKFNDIPFDGSYQPDEASDTEELERIASLRNLLPVERIAQDTFQLLFRDRAFLLRFNELTARAVARLTPSGRPVRVALPVWLKRGVFYRDNGRCVFCGKDLTGAMVLGDAVHYDHIVPLAAHGCNDPTNFQTLCAGCNLRKATAIGTSERYAVFWMLK